jgi:hypothetical protein
MTLSQREKAYDLYTQTLHNNYDNDNEDLR